MTGIRLMGEGVRVIPHAPPTSFADGWRERASCLDLTWMATSTRTGEARKVCAACPVLDECRAWVTDPDTGPVAGVVAGMTMEERGWV